ncbi:MAG TPA: hypothetical protein VGO53_05560, partial [Steroidobacteraceae bacterium]|nr:hypothetical protein [Steroidobacteraceae bacterium]
YNSSNRDWSNKDDAIASNLVSVGILHLLDGLEGSTGELNWYGRVYALTSFGFRFVRACNRQLNHELELLEQQFEEIVHGLKEPRGHGVSVQDN